MTYLHTIHTFGTIHCCTTKDDTTCRDTQLFIVCTLSTEACVNLLIATIRLAQVGICRKFDHLPCCQCCAAIIIIFQGWQLFIRMVYLEMFETSPELKHDSMSLDTTCFQFAVFWHRACSMLRIYTIRACDDGTNAVLIPVMVAVVVLLWSKGLLAVIDTTARMANSDTISNCRMQDL